MEDIHQDAWRGLLLGWDETAGYPIPWRNRDIVVPWDLKPWFPHNLTLFGMASLTFELKIEEEEEKGNSLPLSPLFLNFFLFKFLASWNLKAWESGKVRNRRSDFAIQRFRSKKGKYKIFFYLLPFFFLLSLKSRPKKVNQGVMM